MWSTCEDTRLPSEAVRECGRARPGMLLSVRQTYDSMLTLEAFWSRFFALLAPLLPGARVRAAAVPRCGCHLAACRSYPPRRASRAALHAASNVSRMVR